MTLHRTPTGSRAGPLLGPLLSLLCLPLLLAPLPASAGESSGHLVAETGREAFSKPFPELDPGQLELFYRGRSLFRQNWVAVSPGVPTADTAVDGLGPLYNRLSCAACHQKNSRGTAPELPGERMQSMLVRLSVPGAGPHGGPRPHPAYGEQLNEEGIPGVPGEGRADLVWSTRKVRLADGETVELRSPRVVFRELAYGPLDRVLVSPRVSPAVFGLGLLEAVADETLEQLAASPRPDGIHGRINHVWDEERQQKVAGRFGLKANAPNLRQQSAGAFIGDLGITSPLFPEENCRPVQTACRKAPSGGHPELTAKQLDEVTFYLTHLAVPARRDANAPAVLHGEALFARLGCVHCHLPSLTTASTPRFPLMANRTFAPYTDLLVHDMGRGLADNRPDHEAGGRDWRTAPLWGLGLVPVLGDRPRYLHDGRARNLQEAILWHGGEGKAARDRYARLNKAEREDLLAFLASL